MEEAEGVRPVRGKPGIDRSSCSDCESCLSLGPSIFIRNKETGVIEVAELDDYPEEEIQEAVNYCPENCIALEGPD